MKVKIVTPGTNASYYIPVMKAQKYAIDEIFQKRLLFLIPFYIFTYENRLKEYDSNVEKLNTLIADYENIKSRLEELAIHHTISEFARQTIIDMSNKVLENIAGKYENIKEGVKSVMGGKILEYEAKTIRNEGISQGISQGISMGKMEMLFELVQKGLLSIDDAAMQAKMKSIEFEEKMNVYNEKKHDF